MYCCEIPYLTLAQIAVSGQCFRMKSCSAAEDIYDMVTCGEFVRVRQEGKRFTFSCGEEAYGRVWHKYFDIDRDYGKILSSIDPQDTYLTEAAAKGNGVRILRQDLWEVIVTFLISQNNNITRITNSVEALCQKFGVRKTGDEGTLFYSFPTPEALAAAGLEGLTGMGLGYRDKYILSMAVHCSGKTGEVWLNQLKKCGYDEAKSLLMEQLGIGGKVADCICLFGLGRVEAFPVDTHIRQLLEAHYPGGFPMDRYEGYAGILQQYMFYSKKNQ